VCIMMCSTIFVMRTQYLPLSRIFAFCSRGEGKSTLHVFVGICMLQKASHKDPQLRASFKLPPEASSCETL
jgi:hypothetical protein